MLPHLTDSARRGGVLEIRSLDPRIQHLRGVSAETIEAARARGVAPAAVLRRSDGTFDVWIRHSPSATPETLSFLNRALRVEYGLPPFGPSRTFGPLAGYDPTVQLIQGTGRPYIRAQALADFLAASRRSLDGELAKRLQAVGVSPLAQYRQLHPGLNADREWARFALRQGLAPRDIALELVRSDSRAQTSPRSQALYASRILSSALPAASSRELPKRLLAAASQMLGVSVNVLSTARAIFDQVARRTLGRA